MIAYRELPTKEMEYMDLEKLGIMTGDGKIISQPQYSYVGNFSSGLAPVAIYDSGNSPYFYINTKGQPVFNYKFDEAYPFYKGYALIFIQR